MTLATNVHPGTILGVFNYSHEKGGNLDRPEKRVTIEARRLLGTTHGYASHNDALDAASRLTTGNAWTSAIVQRDNGKYYVYGTRAYSKRLDWERPPVLDRRALDWEQDNVWDNRPFLSPLTAAVDPVELVDGDMWYNSWRGPEVDNIENGYEG